MTTPQKRKGDKAELEVQRILRSSGFPEARRALGAGRLDDVGDVTGVPDTVVQVAAWHDLGRCVREKLPAVAEQMGHARARFGALWCRRFGGKYIVVLTHEQYVDLLKAALGR